MYGDVYVGPAFRRCFGAGRQMASPAVLTLHTSMRFHPIIKNAAALLTGAALLLTPAFLNGYPLVNSDDGTYLASGFMPEMPLDRPIAYGLLLRIFSLNGLSLWTAAAFQALLMTWLIMRITLRTVNGSVVAGFLLTASLALSSSLSWITSEIIPDVCTPMTLLASWLLLNNEEPRRTRMWLFILYLLVVATHISHVMIFGLLIGGFFIFRRWWMPASIRRAAARTVLILGLLTTGAMLTMLKPIGASKHVFTMAALLDGGILKPYLDEVCPVEGYVLCKYKDNLNPDPNHFLWDGSSPAQAEGGWAAVKPEYDRLIADVHSRPKYLRMRASASTRFTLKQAGTFTVGDGNWSFGEGSHVHNAVKQYAPRDERAYLNAWQHTYPDNIEQALKPLNRYLYAFVILSTAALVVLLVLGWRGFSPSLRFFVLFTLAGIFINLWNCATFAQVNGRYGCRVMWLIPFCAALCGVALLKRKKRESRGERGFQGETV